MGQRARVVLIGAGHAHLYLARRAAEFRRRGIELILVDPTGFWYSAMATGMLGGRYSREEDHVDAHALITRSGGRAVRASASRIDLAERVVHLDTGDPIEYDVLSLNIGSVTQSSEVAGAAERAWTVKPIADLWSLRLELEQRFRDDPQRGAQVVVVGGGATGCEVAANIDGLARRWGSRAKITLLTRGSRLVEELPERADELLREFFGARSAEIHFATALESVESGAVTTDDGREHEFDALVLATGLSAPPLVRELGLPVTEDGRLKLTSELHAVGDDRVFGAGDCACPEGHVLPRLGVFAVREAPVLLHNLLALLEGRRLKAFEPQERWLTILNLGDGTALATRGQFVLHGSISMWLKERIDRRFMRKYRLPP